MSQYQSQDLRRGVGNPEVRVTSDLPQRALAEKSLIGEEEGGHDQQRWTVLRVGSSITNLIDGRTLLLGGALSGAPISHNYLFNDAVMYSGSGCSVYHYAADIFAPACHHSATEVCGDVFVIGGRKRQHAVDDAMTSVSRLVLADMSFETCFAKGESPGPIFGHCQSLDATHSNVIVDGGWVETAGSIRHNVDSYSYEIRSGSWRALTRKTFQVWELNRVDGHDLEFWMLMLPYSAWLQEPERFERFRSGDSVVVSGTPETPRPLNLTEMHRLLQPVGTTRNVSSGECVYPEVSVFSLGDARVVVADRGILLSVEVHGPLPSSVVGDLIARMKGSLENIVAAECESECIWIQN